MQMLGSSATSFKLFQRWWSYGGDQIYDEDEIKLSREKTGRIKEFHI